MTKEQAKNLIEKIASLVDSGNNWKVEVNGSRDKKIKVTATEFADL